MRKQMISNLLKKWSDQQPIHLKSYMYKQDLALNNPQELICH